MIADSARAARAELRSQNLVPIKVEAIEAQLDESGHARNRAFGDHLSTVELALFTRQLSSLLEASLPLDQAFSALQEQAERSYERDLFADLCGAADRLGIRQHQTETAVPDRGDVERLGFRAALRLDRFAGRHRAGFRLVACTERSRHQDALARMAVDRPAVWKV